MQLRCYVINLDRAPERWRRISQRADAADIELTRVRGVDGASAGLGESREADQAKFELLNGRFMLPGEYGCYQSHLAALRQFLSDGGEAAIILEDDVEIDAALPLRAAAILDAAPRAGLVRLLSHRNVGFRRRFTSALGDAFGRAALGPQGSAACYLVRRQGAAQLLRALVPMKLPYDVALERGWANGVETYSTGKNLVELGPLMAASQIASRAAYASTKKPTYRRIPAFVFRAGDLVLRLIYSMVR